MRITPASETKPDFLRPRSRAGDIRNSRHAPVNLSTARLRRRGSRVPRRSTIASRLSHGSHADFAPPFRPRAASLGSRPVRKAFSNDRTYSPEVTAKGAISRIIAVRAWTFLAHRRFDRIPNSPANVKRNFRFFEKFFSNSQKAPQRRKKDRFTGPYQPCFHHPLPAPAGLFCLSASRRA